MLSVGPVLPSSRTTFQNLPSVLGPKPNRGGLATLQLPPRSPTTGFCSKKQTHKRTTGNKVCRERGGLLSPSIMGTLNSKSRACSGGTQAAKRDSKWEMTIWISHVGVNTAAGANFICHISLRLAQYKPTGAPGGLAGAGPPVYRWSFPVRAGFTPLF